MITIADIPLKLIRFITGFTWKTVFAILHRRWTFFLLRVYERISRSHLCFEMTFNLSNVCQAAPAVKPQIDYVDGSNADPWRNSLATTLVRFLNFRLPLGRYGPRNRQGWWVCWCPRRDTSCCSQITTNMRGSFWSSRQKVVVVRELCSRICRGKGRRAGSPWTLISPSLSDQPPGRWRECCVGPLLLRRWNIFSVGQILIVGP